MCVTTSEERGRRHQGEVARGTPQAIPTGSAILGLGGIAVDYWKPEVLQSGKGRESSGLKSPVRGNSSNDGKGGLNSRETVNLEYGTMVGSEKKHGKEGVMLRKGK